ncbi:MAG: hypothetical protein Q9M43_14025 [Sulfurimonas sp.]|nr:hypothetical protein [Sulfurimonas sp.]
MFTQKEDHFVDGKRHGIETKYMVSKNNKTVKSTKTYSEGKLHGECLTYNATGEVIKQEIFEHGKLVSKNNEPV